MEAIDYLKKVQQTSYTTQSINDEAMAKIMEEYLQLVCETKTKVFKQSVHQLFRTDMAIKANTTNEEERNFFLGKEMAFRQVIKVVEEIEEMEFQDLLVKVNHRLASIKN